MKINLKNKNAQGTIEYLVIIAIVIVISLVVIGLLLYINDSSTQNISTNSSQLKLTTSTIGIQESALGIGTDANGIITIKNNTGETITYLQIELDGKDHNYTTNLTNSDTKNLKLISLHTPCVSGQKTTNQTLTIKYTNSLGLNKTISYGNVTLNCIETQNPTGKNQTQENNNTIDNGDTTPPTISLSYPSDGLTIDHPDINFIFTTNETTTNCTLYINTIEADTNNNTINTGTDINLTTTITEGTHTYDINCTDTNNNTGNTNGNLTYTPTIVDPCPGETELYGTCWSNVVGYWPFDENADDISGNANNGTTDPANFFLSGGDQQYGSGAINLNGNPVDITGFTLNQTTYSMQFWAKSASNVQGKYLMYALGDGQVIPSFSNAGSAGTPYSLSFADPSWHKFDYPSLDDNKWHHIVFVFNGSTSKVDAYVDGTHAGTQQSWTPRTLQGTTHIGGDAGWSDISLDEVIFFDTALSETDINQLYYDSGGTQIAQLKSGLVAYWPFDETSGSTFFDNTENSYDGTISGANSWTTGKVNNGLAFEGTGCASTNSAISISSSAYTSCFWANITPATSNCSGWEIHSAGYRDQRTFLNSQSWVAWMYTTSSSQVMSQSAILTNNGWNFICVSISSADQNIYVNGELSDQTSRSAGFLFNDILDIGKDNGNCTNSGCTLDEVGFWNRALSINEIAALYNNDNGLSLVN